MARGDREIYVQFNGKMEKVAEPTCSPDKANFVIVYNWRDWSGFRTLAECIAQFPQIENRRNDPFTVVQR